MAGGLQISLLQAVSGGVAQAEISIPNQHPNVHHLNCQKSPYGGQVQTNSR